jgi:ubiquinone/menaquinone biosynthesis C-methylase UbiE
LKKARVKSQNLEVNVKFKRADVENLMFKDEEFDFVIDTLGLCTFSNPIKALKEMKRVCKKKGKVLLLEHGISKNKLVNYFFGKYNSKHYSRVGCSLIRDIFGLVEKSGLKIEEQKRYFFGVVYFIVAEGD